MLGRLQSIDITRSIIRMPRMQPILRPATKIFANSQSPSGGCHVLVVQWLNPTDVGRGDAQVTIR
jgi:hypothetical protein